MIKILLTVSRKDVVISRTIKVVPRAGVEPARPKERGILSPLRLPISPPGQLTKNQLLKAN